MRKMLILLPLLLGASPALAQPPAATLPPELADPAVADKVADMVQGLSDAFLNLPVGEIEAAAEGRKPSPADKRRTVRDLGRRDDPNFDRDLQRRIAEARPMIAQSMKAIQKALPEIMESVQKAQRAIERATANMPDPTYPKR